jgi:hypothetical protein
MHTVQLPKQQMPHRLLAEGSAHGSTEDCEYCYALALGLDLAGACLYSAGLVLQRYALSYPSADGTVNVLGCRMRRGPAWFLGLMTYGSGNAVYTAAMQFAPVSLLTTVFAVALVINAALSKAIMHESIDRAGAWGYVLIMLGIGISAVGLPKDTVVFSARDMNRLAVQPAGVAYLTSMLALIAGLSVIVHKFERDYPAPNATVAARTDDGSHSPLEQAVPVRRLLIAHVAFPTVLSSYETIAQLCIKGATSMMRTPTTEGGSDSDGNQTSSTGEPIFLIVCALGIATTAQAVVWLRKVYARFDTTTILPIEYATLTISTSFGGANEFAQCSRTTTLAFCRPRTPEF